MYVGFRGGKDDGEGCMGWEEGWGKGLLRVMEKLGKGRSDVGEF